MGLFTPVVLGALATQASTPGLIPHNILDKPPSAELKPGQVDQDSLPPYDVLDDILDRLVQRHESIADMVAAGHDAAVVEKRAAVWYLGPSLNAARHRQCSR
jgi:NAD+ synthase (glutamine-hydrolysing)